MTVGISCTGYELMGAEVLPVVVNNIAYVAGIKTKGEIYFIPFLDTYVSIFTLNVASSNKSRKFHFGPV